MSNQPAFPTKINTEYFSNPSTIYDTGMTLRDYFAAKALQALIIREGKDTDFINEITTTAYQYADDMLKERLE